jgi:hypothetical protein
LHQTRIAMPAVLMTLFAVSILGALGLAAYGLRVLLGRWEQPRRPKVLRSVPQLAPVNPSQPIRPVAPSAPPPLPPSVAARSSSVTPARPSTPVFAPAPAWTPPTRAPSPAQPRSGSVPPALPPRLARGSIPPDYTAHLEPDTDPAAPESAEPDAEVMRGDRYSVIRSSRR